MSKEFRLGLLESEILGHPTTITLLACRHLNVLQKFQKDPFFITYESFEKQVIGVTEENVPETEYAYRKLLRSSTDEKILSTLGYKRKGEQIKVFYTHIYEYLKNCPNGWYLFYVGNGMVVFAFRRSDRCDLGVCPMKNPDDWSAGYMFVFCEILKP